VGGVITAYHYFPTALPTPLKGLEKSRSGAWPSVGGEASPLQVPEQEVGGVSTLTDRSARHSPTMLLLGALDQREPRLEVVVELHPGVLEEHPHREGTYDHLLGYLLDLETLAQ
jgi:hypothetical protein